MNLSGFLKKAFVLFVSSASSVVPKKITVSGDMENNIGPSASFMLNTKMNPDWNNSYFGSMPKAFLHEYKCPNDDDCQLVDKDKQVGIVVENEENNTNTTIIWTDALLDFNFTSQAEERILRGTSKADSRDSYNILVPTNGSNEIPVEHGDQMQIAGFFTAFFNGVAGTFAFLVHNNHPAVQFVELVPNDSLNFTLNGNDTVYYVKNVETYKLPNVKAIDYFSCSTKPPYTVRSLACVFSARLLDGRQNICFFVQPLLSQNIGQGVVSGLPTECDDVTNSPIDDSSIVYVSSFPNVAFATKNDFFNYFFTNILGGVMVVFYHEMTNRGDACFNFVGIDTFTGAVSFGLHSNELSVMSLCGCAPNMSALDKLQYLFYEFIDEVAGNSNVFNIKFGFNDLFFNDNNSVDTNLVDSINFDKSTLVMENGKIFVSNLSSLMQSNFSCTVSDIPFSESDIPFSELEESYIYIPFVTLAAVCTISGAVFFIYKNKKASYRVVKDDDAKQDSACSRQSSFLSQGENKDCIVNLDTLVDNFDRPQNLDQNQDLIRSCEMLAFEEVVKMMELEKKDSEQDSEKQKLLSMKATKYVYNHDDNTVEQYPDCSYSGDGTSVISLDIGDIPSEEEEYMCYVGISEDPDLIINYPMLKSLPPSVRMPVLFLKSISKCTGKNFIDIFAEKFQYFYEKLKKENISENPVNTLLSVDTSSKPIELEDSVDKPQLSIVDAKENSSEDEEDIKEPLLPVDVDAKENSSEDEEDIKEPLLFVVDAKSAVATNENRKQMIC